MNWLTLILPVHLTKSMKASGVDVQKSLALGAQVIDIQNTFTNWEEDYAEITHRGKSFLENWANANYQVQTADGETVLFCDGNTLVMDDIAKEVCTILSWYILVFPWYLYFGTGSIWQMDESGYR